MATLNPNGAFLRPGANRRTDAPHDWRFLLEDPEPGHVAVVGPVDAPTLDRLAGIARRVTVVGSDLAGLAPSSVDLVACFDRRWCWRISHEQQLAETVGRMLRRGGQLYLERPARAGGAPLPAPLLGRPQSLWVRRAGGSLLAAAPEDDLRAQHYVADSLGLPYSWSRRVRHTLRGRRPGTGTIVTTGPHGGGPGYLTGLAEQWGLDIGSHSWALAAPGRYRSKKVLVYLFPGDDPTPSHVVKLTRDAEFNPRLANEWRTLDWIHHRLPSMRDAVPRVAFFGFRGGVAIEGQEFVSGGQRIAGTTARRVPRPVVGAVQWLVDLAATTAVPEPSAGASVVGAFEHLVSTFVETYRPDAGLRQKLERQVACVADSTSAYPLVLQHGDPGVWNLLSTEGGTVLLDWESADLRGQPLWDLFHLLRSWGVAVARARGTRDPVTGWLKTATRPGPVSDLQVGAAAEVCRATGLAPDLVEPLFHLCWVHRALKEASRLDPARLDRGRYLSVLRAGLAHRDSPGLRALFDPALLMREEKAAACAS